MIQLTWWAFTLLGLGGVCLGICVTMIYVAYIFSKNRP